MEKKLINNKTKFTKEFLDGLIHQWEVNKGIEGIINLDPYHPDKFIDPSTDTDNKGYLILYSPELKSILDRFKFKWIISAGEDSIFSHLTEFGSYYMNPTLIELHSGKRQLSIQDLSTDQIKLVLISQSDGLGDSSLLLTDNTELAKYLEYNFFDPHYNIHVIVEEDEDEDYKLICMNYIEFLRTEFKLKI